MDKCISNYGNVFYRTYVDFCIEGNTIIFNSEILDYQLAIECDTLYVGLASLCVDNDFRGYITSKYWYEMRKSDELSTELQSILDNHDTFTDIDDYISIIQPTVIKYMDDCNRYADSIEDDYELNYVSKLVKHRFTQDYIKSFLVSNTPFYYAVEEALDNITTDNKHEDIYKIMCDVNSVAYIEACDGKPIDNRSIYYFDNDFVGRLMTIVNVEYERQVNQEKYRRLMERIENKI